MTVRAYGYFETDNFGRCEGCGNYVPENQLTEVATLVICVECFTATVDISPQYTVVVGTVKRSAKSRWTFVEHEPKWEPADLPCDVVGNTKPGYICTHELENGAGQCGGNVFTLADAVGNHCCVVNEVT